MLQGLGLVTRFLGSEFLHLLELEQADQEQSLCFCLFHVVSVNVWLQYDANVSVMLFTLLCLKL